MPVTSFLREKYKLTHNDLTWVNIMYNKIEKGGEWKYITNEYELYIVKIDGRELVRAKTYIYRTYIERQLMN